MRNDKYCGIMFRAVEADDSPLLEKWYGMTDQFGFATGFKSFDDIRDRIMPFQSPACIALMILTSGRAEAVGFVYVEFKNLDRKTVLWIHIIIVDPSFQRKGLGACAINRLLNYAGSQGAIASVVSVSEQNAKGLRFWQKLGFTRSASMEGTLGQPGVAIMKKLL